MGIEKVLPSFQDLEIFLQILPRSATGERMNPYTSLWTGVHPGDGPQEFHLILLDNGRTRVLENPVGRQSLHCIRCSACLNICPVYGRVGGHAYNATYPGPIGSILTPQLLGPGVHDSLPFASTLCGACGEVCPVRIEIPKVLLHLRGRAVETGLKSGFLASLSQERLIMRFLGWVFRSPRAYRWGLSAARKVLERQADRGWVKCLPGYAKGWTTGRDFPALADESFREWWAARGKGRAADPGPRGGAG
jgi:L-lactate dehydrogenase complex protein LldF